LLDAIRMKQVFVLNNFFFRLLNINQFVIEIICKNDRNISYISVIEIAFIVPFNIVSNIVLQKIFWASFISLWL